MTLAALHAEMARLARQLPEYDTVHAMYGVGEITAAQLMAEIGDVRRFPRRSSIEEPVYQFLDKKRSEGKPYFVYMTAAQNKFLRIYYARVKECLETFDAQQNSAQS